MRMIFMGTSEFGIPTLEALLRKEYEIIAVVTAPDKPAGRGRKLGVVPVKSFCLENKLPVVQPENLSDPWFIDNLRKARPELIVVVAFRILPKAVFQIPKFGSINLHASLLPRYRGAAPINRAIMNGETETGVTTFFLEESVDTGSVLVQRSLTIGPDETAGELHDRLAALGAGAVLETVVKIGSKNAAATAQDSSQASAAPKIFRKDCGVDWTKSAPAVHNLIRGLSPRPGAFTHHGGSLLKLHRSKVVSAAWDGPDRPGPGTVLEATGKLLVAAGDGAVELTEVQQEGKSVMKIGEFLNGYSISRGDRLQ